MPLTLLKEKKSEHCMYVVPTNTSSSNRPQSIIEQYNEQETNVLKEKDNVRNLKANFKTSFTKFTTYCSKQKLKKDKASIVFSTHCFIIIS
jgi:hypothetical protein